MTDGHSLRQAIRELVLEVLQEQQNQTQGASGSSLGYVLSVNPDGSVNVSGTQGIFNAGTPRTDLVQGSRVTLIPTDAGTFVAI